MNFEPKYLIRWGIPGWMYLGVLIAYFSLKDYEAISSFIFSKDVPIIVASITLFIGTGIILGNLIHQFSLSFGFIIWQRRYKYFKEEYEIDLKIIKSEYGNEIQRIYSYRLGNVHALRALCTSLFLSLITLGIFSFTIKFSMPIGILILIVFGVNLIALNNFIYFQSNLTYFIKKMKTDFL